MLETIDVVIRIGQTLGIWGGLLLAVGGIISAVISGNIAIPKEDRKEHYKTPKMILFIGMALLLAAFICWNVWLWLK